MQPESKKYLYDIMVACSSIASFTAGKAFPDYQGDPMLRSAVERQMEIAGEALKRLQQKDPNTAERISDRRRIIAFRNILAHAYAHIDDRIVWGVVTNHLQTLQAEVDALLQEANRP